MTDFDVIDGKLVIADTVVHKAANVLQTQEGSLYYAQDFGIDLSTFFNPEVEIQTETFKAYTIERLTAAGVNVLELGEDKRTFDTLLEYSVQFQNNTGMVANGI